MVRSPACYGGASGSCLALHLPPRSHGIDSGLERGLAVLLPLPCGRAGLPGTKKGGGTVVPPPLFTNL